MERHKPIGIFDSGVGGLSIGHTIRELLPREDLLYFADIEFCPYGTKSSSTINDRSERIVDYLINQGCKAIVVACNTATVSSISRLRKKFTVPIIGVEPGVKPAAMQSKTGAIGILATEQTIQSHSFQQLTCRYAKTVNIKARACPQFVALVENLQHNSPEASDVVKQHIQPLLSEGCDQIVLGCTHFSFLMPAIKKVVGDNAGIIDTATSVAIELNRQLGRHKLRRVEAGTGTIDFLTSGNLENSKEVMRVLWGQEINGLAVRL